MDFGCNGTGSGWAPSRGRNTGRGNWRSGGASGEWGERPASGEAVDGRSREIMDKSEEKDRKEETLL